MTAHPDSDGHVSAGKQFPHSFGTSRQGIAAITPKNVAGAGWTTPSSQAIFQAGDGSTPSGGVPPNTGFETTLGPHN